MKAWLLAWVRVFFPPLEFEENPYLRRKAERQLRYKELQRKAFEGKHHGH